MSRYSRLHASLLRSTLSLSARVSSYERVTKHKEREALLMRFTLLDHRLRRLLAHFNQHRVATWRSALYSVLNKLLDLAPPLLIGLAVDVVVAQRASYLATWLPDPSAQLYLLGALTLLIWGGESLFEYLYQLSWRNLAQQIQRDLRADVYRHLHDLDAGWFSEQQTGDLLATLNDDINQLERFFNVGANHLIQVITTTITVSAVFFYTAPSVAIWSMLPIPVILWGSFRFQRQIGPRYTLVRHRAAEISAQLTHTLRGMDEVKSFTAEAREVDRLNTLSEAYVDANREAIKLSSAFTPLIRIAIVVGFLATLIYGGELTLRGELAVGTYSVLVFLTQRLLWPLTRLGETVDLYQRALASAQRAFAILDVEPTPHQGERVLSVSELESAVELRSVRFEYPDQPPLFTDLSLSIAPRGVTAIVGSTGSGKSSLARLILGFNRPSAGEIYVGEHPLSDLDLTAWRAQVGLVSQDVYLFDGTLIDNIRYGRPNASDAEVYIAAERAGVALFVDHLSAGYETRVGEGGSRLSGGERQRVSIARALLKDPMLLILDEATSAIDPYTEAFIQDQLESACADKTVLVIAHRLNTIQRAQRIVVLHRGSVVEQGSHAELIQRGEIYARLWGARDDKGALDL